MKTPLGKCFFRLWSRDYFRNLNENWSFDRHYETEHFVNVIFADLWLS